MSDIPAVNVRNVRQYTLPPTKLMPPDLWRSGGLASWDKHFTGTLSEPTDRSLRRTMTLLTADGLFKTHNEVEIPYITTTFELTVQTARAVALCGEVPKLD